MLTDEYIDVLATTTQQVRAVGPLAPGGHLARRSGPGGGARADLRGHPRHSLDVLEHPSVRTIIERGMLWASR